jgi:extracellular factor (EF) 3-hydroxypalmitic acid methyl ester biosynthesis protein
MNEVSSIEGIIGYRTSSGLVQQATLIKLSRHAVVFEAYNSTGLLRTSEILDDFIVSIQGKQIFYGKAVVKSLVEIGLVQCCEASLDQGWVDVNFDALNQNAALLKGAFQDFFKSWQSSYKIVPVFKLLAIDVQTMLTDYRLWLDQVEVGVRASPSADRIQLEQEIAENLESEMFPPLDVLFEKYEQVATQIDPETLPAHQHFIRRATHPLVLNSPFAFRCVTKPLGYAGDYEVVNMILSDAHQGGTLFAKILNRWFIKQPPAEAHRNRIDYLVEKLYQESARALSNYQRFRVYNLGCGPAVEIQRFLKNYPISDKVDFELIDFNEETLVHAQSKLREMAASHGRRTSMDFHKKSVAQILKARGKSTVISPDMQYDFIYCAGLFDYLPDSTCKHLLNIFYGMIRPGGLIMATNVTPANPIKHWLSDILDWYLIYRDAAHMRKLCPSQTPPDGINTFTDLTGVNVFLEIRKPNS